MEVAVCNNLGVLLVVGVGVNVCKVGGDCLAADREGSGVKDMQLSSFAFAASIAACVPSAAAFALISESSTEPVASVPVQSAAIASPDFAQLTMYSK